MAITPKPKPSAAHTSLPVDVDALISKGGSTPSLQQMETKTEAAILLRIPQPMLQQIDVLLKARPLKTPRHRWILEAVHEKLIRESSD